MTMGVQASLRKGERQLAALPDPDRGTFDAAGDFDRLILGADASFPIFSRVDPHGDLDLSPHDIPNLISEVDRLLPLAQPGPERRGLLRLRALAQRCATTPGTSIAFLGD